MMKDLGHHLTYYWTSSERFKSEDEKAAEVSLLDKSLELESSASGDDSNDSISSSTDVPRWRQVTASNEAAPLWTPISSLHNSFNPSIEGLRGIAISMTLLSHILPNHLLLLQSVIGSTGVTVFFVLSGFLITGVLIRLESKSESRFGHLRQFYTDRLFRLGPALILVVGLFFPILIRSGVDSGFVSRFAILTLCYLTNITGDRGPWGNTWSLSCEEQFYVIWSIAIPFTIPRGVLMRATILTSLITSSLFFGIYASTTSAGVFGGQDLHFGLLPNVWKMFVGASLRLIHLPKYLLKKQWAFVGLFGLTISLTLPLLPQPRYEDLITAWKDPTRPLSTITDLISAISTSLILCAVSGPQKGVFLLEVHPLRFIGRISYSWYLWQYPVVRLNGWRRGYPAIGDTAITFVIAMVSTIYVEEPINRAYKRWKTQRNNSTIIPV